MVAIRSAPIPWGTKWVSQFVTGSNANGPPSDPIGTRLMHLMMERYTDFHQQALLADGKAVAFYEKCGFSRAGGTRPMWIYAGHDHD